MVPSDAADAASTSANGKTSAFSFDDVVAAIENVMDEAKFDNRLNAFVQEHCNIFDDAEENKLEYTPIFEEYTAMVEKHLEHELGAKLQGFDMAAFSQNLVDRAKDGEPLPMTLENLAAVGDFATFKQMMLSAQGLSVSSFGAAVAVKVDVADDVPAPQQPKPETVQIVPSAPTVDVSDSPSPAPAPAPADEPKRGVAPAASVSAASAPAIRFGAPMVKSWGGLPDGMLKTSDVAENIERVKQVEFTPQYSISSAGSSSSHNEASSSGTVK